MIRSFFLLSVLLAFPISLLAGTISGTVHARGKPEADKEAATANGKYGSRSLKFAERLNYDELRDFVVYIADTVTNAAAPTKPVQVITQKDAVFRPHVLPVMVGTVVEWPNRDDIFHNVFSMSEANPFDLGLYKDPEIKSVPFKRTGRVDVFCSIHTKMNCIILVLPSPFFAVSNPQGRFTINNVPAGKYKLEAWHERLPSQVKEVVVPKEGTVEMDFTLGIIDLPKY